MPTQLTSTMVDRSYYILDFYYKTSSTKITWSGIVVQIIAESGDPNLFAFGSTNETYWATLKDVTDESLVLSVNDLESSHDYKTPLKLHLYANGELTNAIIQFAYLDNSIRVGSNI